MHLNQIVNTCFQYFSIISFKNYQQKRRYRHEFPRNQESKAIAQDNYQYHCKIKPDKCPEVYGPSQRSLLLVIGFQITTGKEESGERCEVNEEDEEGGEGIGTNVKSVKSVKNVKIVKSVKREKNVEGGEGDG